MKKQLNPTKWYPAWLRRKLVAWGWMKPHLVYNGRFVSPFPVKGANRRNTMLKEYIKIRLKISRLNAKKRSFVVNLVEKWLLENDIDPNTYSNELLHYETGAPHRY